MYLILNHRRSTKATNEPKSQRTNDMIDHSSTSVIGSSLNNLSSKPSSIIFTNEKLEKLRNYLQKTLSSTTIANNYEKKYDLVKVYENQNCIIFNYKTRARNSLSGEGKAGVRFDIQKKLIKI